jgi:2-polyprenyl-6-methoxyphenol hydroxylase-like FAD-dependent oxidoreductase
VRTAVVVGAGIAGLATAGALARAGWTVTLLERTDRIRAAKPMAVPGPTGHLSDADADTAGWFIWPNGVRALRALGLSAGLDAIASPLRGGGIRYPDGRWLVPPPPPAPAATAISAGAPPLAVSREDLHDALVAGLGSVELRTGVEIRQVRQLAGQPPAVGDGSRIFSADLIVAADGMDSAVRQRLDPTVAVRDAGCAAWRAVVPWYHAPASATGREPASETLGAGYRFQYASLGARGNAGASRRGGVYWVATAPGAARPESPATQLGLLRRWFAGWHAPIGDLLAATEPADLVPHRVCELTPVPLRFDFPVGTGGFVLLGDAAHAMAHHLGQGAALALEDAATLVNLVGTASPEQLPAALSEFTRRRRPRVLAVARQTKRVGAVVQARGRLALAARDATLRTLNPRFWDKASAVAADWRPI